MHCPNCGKPFHGGNQCPHCQIDVVLFKGTEQLSARLYNKGLERLYALDFTQAIQELTRSISINKHNVQARNLLGLALFEIGHVGEALKHWVISQSLLRDGNPANAYLEKINKNTRSLERLNEAVVLYNRAVEFIRQNSDDLAVIQLKKALEFNPRFVDALNLLTLCYLQQKNRQQAAATMERVFAIDVRNPIAMRYYNIINPARTRAEPRVRLPMKQNGRNGGDKPGETGPYKTLAIKEKKSTLFHAVGILSFIFGAACMLAIGYFLFIPATQREHDIAMQNLQRQMDINTTNHQSALEARDATESTLRDEIMRLEDEIENAHAQFILRDRAVHVMIANEIYRNGGIENMRDAADALALIPPEGLAFDIVEVMNGIIASAHPQLAAHYTTGGINSFNTGDYDRAMVQLQDARHFIAPDDAQVPNILYHLGTLYYRDPLRRVNAIETLMELTALEGFEDLPANPWNARRNRVEAMLEALGA